MEKTTSFLLIERVRMYYTPVDPCNTENFMFFCEVDGCRKQVNGKKSSNLTVHIRKVHTDFFRKNIGRISKSEYEQMPVKRLKFIQNCSEIIVIGGRPFRALNDVGFLGITEEKRCELIASGYSSGLHAPHFTAVKTHIAFLAGQIFQQIKSDVRNAFVSIMVDGATKYNRSILGINIQYIVNGHHILRCIGMINLTAGHTAEYLKTQILNRLKVFGIECAQMISVTTDNAPNMLAAAALIDKHYDPLQRSDSGEESDGDDDNHDDAGAINNINLFGIMDDEGDDSDDVVCDGGVAVNKHCDLLEELLNDDDIYRNTLDELKERLNQTTLNVTGVRCGLHFLQLAVKDALKALNSLLINICRTVCKLLRTQSAIYKLRSHGIVIKVPRLDVATRWNSLSLMVSVSVFPS